MSENCKMCPRECNIPRNLSAGFCGQSDKIKISRAALHHWEEPCISGPGGSGAVFFSGCTLKCVYCQNYELSKNNFGEEISKERLAEIFLELEAQGADNINLVTPTHFARGIIDALEIVKNKLSIPVVYNTSGFEKTETIKMLKDYVDIYLTDVKYFNPDFALKYSGAENYPEIAFSALDEMIKQKELKFSSDGMIKQGVIIRHLVLPNLRKDSIEVLSEIKRRFGTESFILSLMSQYTPNNNLKNFPELNRKITSFEYKSVVDYAVDLGFKYGFMQERCSAEKEYIPPFDLTGVKKER